MENTIKQQNKNWKVQIQVNGKRKFLGCFDNEEDARNTYLEAKAKYHIIQERV